MNFQDALAIAYPTQNFTRYTVTDKLSGEVKAISCPLYKSFAACWQRRLELIHEIEGTTKDLKVLNRYWIAEILPTGEMKEIYSHQVGKMLDAAANPDCERCQDKKYPVPHTANADCKSGKRDHCTCDSCF